MITMSPPEDDGRPDRQSGAPPDVVWPVVNHVFEPFAGDELSSPVFTPKAGKVLEAKLEPLPAPLQRIRFAIAEADGRESIRRIARLTFDSDWSRNSRKSWAERAIVAIDEIVRGTRPDCDRWDDLQQHAPLTHDVPAGNGRRSIWHLLPAFVVLAFWLALFCLSLFAEVSNGLFLVEGSGIGFHNDPLGAICFACVYVVAPLVVFKFARRHLNGREQQAFRSRLKWIALPAVIAGVVLFGVKMGLMHEAIDIFAGQSGWQPPLWLLITTSMLLLSLTVLILPLFIADAMQGIWQTEPVKGRMYTFATDQFNRRKTVIAEWIAARDKMQKILDQLSHERELFAENCLGELFRFDAQMNARVDRIRGDIFDPTGGDDDDDN